VTGLPLPDVAKPTITTGSKKLSASKSASFSASRVFGVIAID
jgi:hypothetical protein